jgi:phosphoglucomutase
MKPENILTVPEQMIIDGNFPTVEYPNPEYKEVFALGMKIAEQNGCGLIIGTDPDADRMGIMLKTGGGDFETMTGNQVGALLLDYIITSRKENGALKNNACAVTTIVSTALAKKICEHNGVKCAEVLTGFKFIGEKIKQFEETGEHDFIFGFEESYGYLAGTYARDKDAVVASMLITEMAAHYMSSNMTLHDAMQKIYEKYGYSEESTQNISFPGVDGTEKMKKIMAAIRANPPASIGEYKIAAFRDYKTSEIINLATGEKSGTGLPKSDVLYFDLENGSKAVIRPSGTEPKIKIYYLLCAPDKKSAAEQSEKLMAAMKKFIVL